MMKIQFAEVFAIAYINLFVFKPSMHKPNISGFYFYN